MALNLSAEQKSILNLFTGQDRYLIPSYQRPYSWGEDECKQLWDDIIEAFNNQTDYFMGHMIVAKSSSGDDELEVIDGQQRLTTLSLLLKIYFIFDDQNKALHNALWIQDWRSEHKIQRLQTNVFEVKDNDYLSFVLNLTPDQFQESYLNCLDKQGNLSRKNCRNIFLFNAMILYHGVKLYIELHDIKSLVDFTLRKVYILPIQLGGDNILQARENALKIFETINNRGKNLSDADIFKAYLYNLASAKKEENLFIDLWSQLRENCESLRITIDDIFRFYSHIIRGKEGIKTSEIGLREFFTQKDYSPLKLKNYDEILNDLFQIIEILNFFEKILKMNDDNNEFTRWFQLIKEYTNQYPKTAMVVYAFNNGTELTTAFIEFLKSLIRYAYYLGSTTNVKFEIHDMIISISHGKNISKYHKTVSTKYFDYLGALKKGYALLAFYLQENSSLNSYYFDKIILPKDRDFLDSSWDNIKMYEIIDTLGNYVVLDMPPKNLPYRKKGNYYFLSQYECNKKLSYELEQWSYEKYIERNDRLKQLLVNFFEGDESNL